MSKEGGVTIFEFISRNPDLTCAEISAATGRPRESVSRMIGQLNALKSATIQF
ncbi:MarR family transcriptional regulator [Salmonella enterica subsp. enterica serovar Kuessel]|nr:MarR family transcriptional regulator [Salmonella enterica subsp. enterica serovar Kuessel]